MRFFIDSKVPYPTATLNADIFKIKKDIELAGIIMDALKRNIPIDARIRNE